MNNLSNQTAYEIGREYSVQLQELCQAYERVSGKPISADDHFFWDATIVNKIETLTAFWWQIGKFNDPLFYDDSWIEEQENEEN